VLRERAFYAKYAEELSGAERVLRKLDEMAETMPVDAPWLAPEADVWDRVTTGQWYDSQGLSRVARTLLEICTVGILAVPTVEVSLLCLLHNVAVCGVTADLLAQSEGGAQTRRFAGGTSQIPLRLAAALGDRVVVDSPVLTIDYTDDHVVVTCRGGLVAAGRQVIVALSPALAGRIMYDPPLPGVRDQLTQRMPLASAHKMFAIYDEPFWRLERVHGGGRRGRPPSGPTGARGHLRDHRGEGPATSRSRSPCWMARQARGSRQEGSSPAAPHNHPAAGQSPISGVVPSRPGYHHQPAGREMDGE
jgi:monoamine oxidase